MGEVIQFPQLSNIKRQRSLDELVEITESILDLARAGDWSAAVDCQRERRQKLEVFFASPPDQSEANAVATVTQAILDIDAKVTDILHNQRRQMLEDAGRTREGHVAVSAYLSHD